MSNELQSRSQEQTIKATDLLLFRLSMHRWPFNVYSLLLARSQPFAQTPRAGIPVQLRTVRLQGEAARPHQAALENPRQGRRQDLQVSVLRLCLQQFGKCWKMVVQSVFLSKLSRVFRKTFANTSWRPPGTRESSCTSVNTATTSRHASKAIWWRNISRTCNSHTAWPRRQPNPSKSLRNKL